MLTREQFQQLREKGLTLEQIVAFEEGKTPEDLSRQEELKTETAGNVFETKKQTGFLGKARDFITGIVGGEKIAKGLGQAIAAPSVQKNLSEAQNLLSDTQNELIQKIKENKDKGIDTSRLENTLKNHQQAMAILSDTQKDWGESLVTPREVIGSAGKLAAFAGGGYLAKTAAKITALGKATSFAGGALRGAGAGAITGGVEGGIYGAGTALEEKKTAKEALVAGGIGAGVGGLAGGVIGAAVGGFTGFRQATKEKAMKNIVPKVKDLSPTQYDELLSKNRIQPKTKTSPAQYILSKEEKETVEKFPYLIKKDPVKTIININNEIGSIDGDVGKFLEKNNVIFSKGELKNSLTSALKDITDINIDEGRLLKEKNKLVNNFVNSLTKNDAKTLWIMRKNYDQKIEQAFSGSYSLQKELKKTLRNAVQDFIADRTPDKIYKGYMKDMTRLFNLRDIAKISANKERAMSGIRLWMKNNPIKTKIVGYSGGIVLGKFIWDKLFPKSSAH